MTQTTLPEPLQMTSVWAIMNILGCKREKERKKEGNSNYARLERDSTYARLADEVLKNVQPVEGWQQRRIAAESTSHYSWWPLAIMLHAVNKCISLKH